MASVAQLMMFVHDFDMDVEEAAHWPRIDVSGPDLVSADRRLPDDVVRALAATGRVSWWIMMCCPSISRGLVPLMPEPEDYCGESVTPIHLGLLRLGVSSWTLAGYLSPQELLGRKIVAYLLSGGNPSVKIDVFAHGPH